MIDATPLSAVTALKQNLQSQISNAAQASGQASQRRSVDELSQNAQDASDLNSAAGSYPAPTQDPYRGNQVDTTA